MAGGEKTEAPTPKRLEEARKKGQVAKSNDLNGAVVLFAGLLVLGAGGPSMVGHVREVMTASLAQIADPNVVSTSGLGTLLRRTGQEMLAALAPVCIACAAAAVVVNVGQVGFRPSLTPLKPDFKKLNPASGFKQIYGPQALAELAKNLIKVGAVAAIVAGALLPQLGQLGGMVGVGAQELSGQMSHTISSLARRAAVAYLLIGLADFAYQKRRLLKQLRMDKQEVKEEAKQQQLPPEVRSAIRRRQMAAARARMMAAVPTADVVVTNPTHYSVALKYDGSAPAPEVVAKGRDLVALKIRELASDHGVPVVPDPPLARSLHASVEVGQQVPEDLYEAVAQLLAFVYRVAAARRASA
ncbi:MAG TPA: flagellar biosynthesis protein FlhB [Solirubrobacteraceae bacterium]